MEMTNKKWYLYILWAYKMQSLVLLCIALILYIYFRIDEWKNPTSMKVFGGTPFYAVAFFLYFEIIFVPANTLFLVILRNIECNRIKINTKRSIVIFTVSYLLMWGINDYLTDFVKYTWIMLLLNYLGLCIGIIILNVIAIILKKCKCFKK